MLTRDQLCNKDFTLAVLNLRMHDLACLSYTTQCKNSTIKSKINSIDIICTTDRILYYYLRWLFDYDVVQNN